MNLGIAAKLALLLALVGALAAGVTGFYAFQTSRALLVESAHWRARVDRVLVVDCDEATQIARVGSRSGLSAPAVQAIVAQQASREQRRSCADAVVHNEDLSLEELEQQVRQLWMLWVPSHR